MARAHSTSTLHYQTYEQAYGEAFEDITHRRPILDKLHALTGFTPKWTLEQTLDDLIATERKKLLQEAMHAA